jgi:hypothetical protein
MAKMQWQCTMSLDGFIAGPGGDMSWLTEHLGPNPTVHAVGRSPQPGTGGGSQAQTLRWPGQPGI